MSAYRPSRLIEGFPVLPQGWTSDGQHYLAADGTTKIFAVTHRKETGPVKKVLYIIHGLAEHCGRFYHYPHYLQGAVDAVVCIDHRGHGQSEGPRGHIEAFGVYADDTAAVVTQVRDRLAKESGGPIENHFFAHSMGGLVGLLTLHRHPELRFQSATVSSPLLGVKVKVPAWKKAPAYALASLWPTFTLPSGLDPATVSRDPNVVKAYKDDPLVHDKVSAKWFVDLQATLAEMGAVHGGIKTPLLFVLPQEDQIVDYDAALKWAQSLQSADKKILSLPGYYHESFNDVEKEKPFAAVKEWISTHSMG